MNHFTRIMVTTPRCRKALDYAGESLAEFGHAHATSAHLVMGLLTLEGGVASNVLREFGLSLETVREFVSGLRLDDAGEANEVTVRYELRVGKSARWAIERAEKEARAMRHTYLGTEHLLLGILAEERGEAADLFAARRVDAGKLRDVVMEELK